MLVITPSFDANLDGHMGIEREFVLIRDEHLVPLSERFMSNYADLGGYGGRTDRWTAELSACQVEDRTRPCANLSKLRRDLESGNLIGEQVAARSDCELQVMEVLPEDMPGDIHPSYAHLEERLPASVLLAASRVAGTHLHIGCANLERAIDLHDRLCDVLPSIIALTDHTQGERMRLYHHVVQFTMGTYAPRQPGTSPRYGTPEQWRAYLADLQVTNLAECYDLVRISSYGTVELRAPGVTDDLDELLSWIEAIRGMIGLS